MEDSIGERPTSASRRTFLRAAGGAAAVAGTGVARGQEVAETYEFGGEVAGWEGRAPASIEGETNPTLNLEAGETYEFVWENLDGAPHNFVIRDAEENVLAETETMSEQGATRSVTATVEEAATTYVCTVHPNTMVGDVTFGAADGEQGPGTPLGVPWSLLMLGGFVVVAVLSPIAFAVVLWRSYLPRGERSGDRAGTEPRR
jgi:plastocyanin